MKAKIVIELESKLAESTVLNLDILTQYTSAIGGKALLGSVDIFAQQYPLYLAELKTLQQEGDEKGVAAQGHKMKGAAGAIGLARLCEWAQYIQHNETQDWSQGYPKFISQIESCYEQDIATLRRYLESV